MSEPIAALVQKAGAAGNSGRWAEAAVLWRQVLQIEPKHPQALFALGVDAMRSGDLKLARDRIEVACAVSPKEPMFALTLGRILREMGDVEGEGAAIDASLAIDPYFLPGLLAKAAWFERLGARPTAAHFFRNALKIAPPEAHWPAPLAAQLRHAREVSETHARDFLVYLDERTRALRQDLAPSARERWNEAASIMSGRSQPYVSQSNQLMAPRLPAIPFFDRSSFAWAADLEAQTGAIRGELERALASQADQFTPYIALRDGQPQDQWASLNRSTRWSHFGLWRNGKPDEAHLAQCPVTHAALQACELADMEGLCPNAMFSALAPHTEIPPHHGETNARVVVHLPLIVPPDCTYRVGFEHRQWEVGKILVFDDTIEHTARNDSDELRVVLIFDIWNPLLDVAEREVVRALASAARDYEQQLS